MKHLIKYTSVIALLVLVVFAISSCKKGGTAKKEHKDIAFLQDAHWNKGKAEYQSYKGSVKWYGKSRDLFGSMTILVKEPWDIRENVKTATKSMSGAVLKFSTFDQFKTGTYNYSFKADIFFDIDNGRVLKYTMGSQDGCGNNFLVYERVRNKTGVFTWFSYWNNQGTIVIKKPTSSFDTFFDAIPLYARFRLNEKSYKLNVIQPLIGNHPPGTKKLSKAKIPGDYPKIIPVTVSNTEEIYNGKDVIKVSVSHGTSTDVYILDKAFPHTLLEQTAKITKSLRVSKFFPYWSPDNRGQEAGYLLKSAVK